MPRFLCQKIPTIRDEVVTAPHNMSWKDNIQEILTDFFLQPAWTISNFTIHAVFLVNSDQALVYYSAGALETYHTIGGKQVEAAGKDELHVFTLTVGISLGGEVLPFQAIFARKTAASLPSSKAPGYPKATEELKFHFESSKGGNHWSKIETIKSYVNNILAPYFESRHKKLSLPNQICIWQVNCWSVHRSLEFRSWMYTASPWIRIHFVPGNCTGLFQSCDVGIQQVLKLAIRQSALKDIVDHTTTQLSSGVAPN